MPGSRSSSALTRLVLPPPEGAATTNRQPEAPGLRVVMVIALRSRVPPYSLEFCTCSRICSISTFSSSETCDSSASTDLEPSVLASRCSSCARKSRRLPTAAALRQHAAHFGDVRGQAREFLGDVDPRGEQRQLLLEPLVVRLEARFAQPCAELFHVSRVQRGHPRRHARRPASRCRVQHASSTTRSLLPSRARADVSSASACEQQRVDLLCERFRRQRRVDQHARPAQDVR